MLNKKILLSTLFAGLTTFGICLTANAGVPGPYIGGTIGWGDTGYDNLIGDHGVRVDDTGLAGGGNLGYQFNCNFAAEAGYTQFSTTDISQDIYPGYTLNSHINEYAIDLVGKGIIPLQNGFSLFGKLGGAYVNANDSSHKLIIGNYVYSNANSAHDIYPTGSVGISYDITPNLPVDLTYTRIQRVDGGSIASTNYVGVGLTYNFG